MLYVVPDCEFCARARAVLEARPVRWREVVVTPDAWAARLEMFARGGASHVPLLVGAGHVQIGFDEPAFQQIIDAALAEQARAGTSPER